MSTKRRRRSRSTIFLTVVSVGALLTLMAAIIVPALERRPVVRWQAGPALSPVQHFDTLPPGTPLSLEIDLPFPAWVYVASFAPLQGTIALFPSQYLVTDLADPLAAGKHVLPGASDQGPISWPTADVIGPVSYLVVASEKMVPELEQVFPRIRQMGNKVFADRSMHLFMPHRSEEQPAPLPLRSELPAPALRAADQLVEVSPDGPMMPWKDHPGIWLKALKIQSATPSPQSRAQGK